MISTAYAQDDTQMTAETVQVNPDLLGSQPPNATEALIWNIGMIVVLVVMFYVLLIRPQQKRFTAHKAMLDALGKGDKVVTAGGLIGKIEKFIGDDEVVVDLGNDIKVTAMRHTIQTKVDKGAKKDETK